MEDREEADFLKIIDTIGSDAFRLGGGSRKGFGSIRVISALYRKLDLSQESDLRLYLDNTSSLRDGREGFASYALKPVEGEATLHYEVSLQPVDFLMFGSGLGDNEADRVYVSEQQIVWDQEGVGSIQERTASILIPSSSVKGALSHRTAYHYNKQCGIFADRLAGRNIRVKTTKLCVYSSEARAMVRVATSDVAVCSLPTSLWSVQIVQRIMSSIMSRSTALQEEASEAHSSLRRRSIPTLRRSS